jgi:magnesium-transporting ATPase (P-type)
MARRSSRSLALNPASRPSLAIRDSNGDQAKLVAIGYRLRAARARCHAAAAAPSIFPSFVGVALLALTLWAFFWMKSKGASQELARAVAVNALVIGQIFYLLNSRYKFDSSLSPKAHFGNKYFPLGIGAVVVLQLLFTYALPFQALFETEAIPLWVWPWLLLGGVVFFLVAEAEKMIIRATAPFRRSAVVAQAGR